MKGIGNIAIAILFFITQALGDATATMTGTPGKTVIVFGDDLAFGAGATTNGLVEWLRIDGFHVVNAGRIGNTAQLALGRLQSDVLSMAPDIAVVILGGNDSFRNVPLQETRLNLFNIVARIQDAGAKVALVSVTGMDIAYHKILADIKEALGVAVIADATEGIPNPYVIGGAFPNDQGYRKIALKVAPVISKLALGLPTTPVPSIKYSVDENEKRLVTIHWTAETGVSYEIIEPYLYGNIVGWNNVATVEGRTGQMGVTLPAEDQLSMFRLRATRK